MVVSSFLEVNTICITSGFVLAVHGTLSLLPLKGISVAFYIFCITEELIQLSQPDSSATVRNISAVSYVENHILQHLLHASEVRFCIPFRARISATHVSSSLTRVPSYLSHSTCFGVVLSILTVARSISFFLVTPMNSDFFVGPHYHSPTLLHWSLHQSLYILNVICYHDHVVYISYVVDAFVSYLHPSAFSQFFHYQLGN